MSGEVNVGVNTQKIIVEPTTKSVSVKVAGPQGPRGIPGVGVGGTGVPEGGATNKALVKASATDYDVEWSSFSPSGFSFVQDTIPTGTESGQTWFDTSSGRSYIWYDDGTTQQWVESSTSAATEPIYKGLVAMAVNPTVGTSNITSVTNVLSSDGVNPLSVSFTAEPGHIYKVSATCLLDPQPTSGNQTGRTNIYVTPPAGPEYELQIGRTALQAGLGSSSCDILWVGELAVGDYTMTLRAGLIAGNGYINVVVGQWYPAVLLVEDITEGVEGSGGSSFDGNHVLTGDPNNPPLALLDNQLLWDGDSTLTPVATEWTALPTYGTGWENYVSGGWQVGQYRKVGDEVQLRGLLKFTYSGDATYTICGLPVGFRPPENQLFACLANYVYNGISLEETFRVSVYSGGGVVLQASNAFVSAQGTSANIITLIGLNINYIDLSQIRFSTST